MTTKPERVSDLLTSAAEVHAAVAYALDREGIDPATYSVTIDGHDGASIGVQLREVDHVDRLPLVMGLDASDMERHPIEPAGGGVPWIRHRRTVVLDGVQIRLWAPVYEA
jgi:hypothetical protein